MKSSLYCYSSNTNEAHNVDSEDYKSPFLDDFRHQREIQAIGETHLKYPQPDGGLLEIIVVHSSGCGGIGVVHHPPGRGEKLVASADAVWLPKAHKEMWPNFARHFDDWSKHNEALKARPIYMPDEFVLRTNIPWCIHTFRPDAYGYGEEMLHKTLDIIISATLALMEIDLPTAN